MALENGLVDKLGDLSDALNIAAELSEIKEFNRKEKFNKSKPVTKWESQNTLDC